LRFVVRSYLSSERSSGGLRLARYLFAVFYHSVLPLVVFYAFLVTVWFWVRLVLLLLLLFLVFFHFELGDS
jgi:hypothetical protein